MPYPKMMIALPIISRQNVAKLSQKAGPSEVLNTIAPRISVPLCDISLPLAGTKVATSMKKLISAKRQDMKEKMGRTKWLLLRLIVTRAATMARKVKMQEMG